MRWTERHLFGLSEKVVRPAIQHHPSNHPQGHQLLWNQFGRVQMIERKAVSFLLCEQLDREFPLGKIAGFDRLEHIAAMEVLISAGDLDRLVPNGRLQAEPGTPMEFYEGRLA